MLLTAVEIDNNKLSIDKRLDEIVSSYLKVRLSKKFREYKKLNEDSLLKMTDDKEKAEFLDKIKEQLKEQIKDDDETKNYREQQREILISKSENYFVVRETLNDLNELNEFSADIERSQLQLVDNFKTPDELVKLNIVYYEKFKKYKQIRHENIDNYLKSYKDKKLPFNDDDLSLVIKMRELYKIDKTVDDIELFDKYDMQTNIDFSNKLGDYYLHKQANNNFHENIVNDWYRDTTNPIEKLSKRIIINNKFLGLLLLTNSGTGRTSFISNNSVTCLATTYSNNVNNKLIYVTRTLGELFLEITNPELKDIPKETRQQIYMTYDGTRPTSDMYYKWNGLQVFDIDLKEWDQVNLIEIFKRKLYEQLSNYHWFLWICKSSSGKGIHIYTKVTPPHHVYTDVTDNEYISKYWHKINYWHKSTIIYDLIRQIHLDKSNTLRFNESVFNDNYEINYLDNSVGRITSGIRLSYDKDILVNYNFLDLHVSIFDLKQDNIEKTKINLFRLTKINNKFLDNISELTVGDIKDMKEKISEEIDLSKYEFAGDFNNIQLIPRNQINYNIRYNVVNTLAAMFGKDGLPLAHKILQSEECKNVKEINSFYSCAISNKKEPTKLGLDILKKVGILKSIKQEVKNVTDNIFKNGIKKAIEKSLNNKFEKPNIELGPTEFLSDKNDILLNPLNGGFTNDKINILLSPPGSGKCLGYNTPVLMYDGSIKSVQDIKVGDQLMGIDSKPRNVLSIARGREEMFRIIPNKGEPWTCNKSHILSVIESGKWLYKCGETINPLDIEDINITNILNLPKNHKKKLFRVPLDFEHKSVEIPPYILGLWLGDGNSIKPEIAVGGKDIDIQKPLMEAFAKKYGCDLSITKDLRNDVYSLCCVRPENIRHNTKIKNNIYEMFKNNNLFSNKHIPKDYLLNSRKTRLLLFAGFIDSDGGGSNGTYDIAIKTDRLKDDIVWLCRSLGYNVSVSKKLVKQLNGKEINKEYWRLIISGDFTDLNKYIRIKRKCFERKINKNPLVTGFKIESIGEGDYYGFEIDGDHRFMLGDFTVTHNTYWLLELARQGKKILLVEPFISVIKNKVESDEELMKIFQVFYDSVKLDELLPDKSAICTFDKFARCNYEKVSNMFDYVCIDESHLLFTSSYRIDTTSASIRKIKELFFISSNNPFAAKLILMTGTETGDTYFFGDIGNVIRVSKKSNQKDIEFLICDDSLDCVTRLSNKAYQLINEGYRLLIPTNKGEIYSQKLIGMVEHLLQREVKFGYYKRSNTEQEICKLINEQNTVGDYEIIFCSNYLSVGVDIVDKCKFASLYFGPFSGYEVEQFNARIRKTGIKTIYCIQTETNDGTTNDLLIEEPNLVLKLTEEDIENFKDDKQIAKAKQEFIAQYDPVLHKIVTPGFSVLNNVIKFNKEEYELTTFENKFLEVMVHPVKVARELSKYGYNVSISDEYEGLSLAQQEELKKIGLNSARNEKIRKHNLLVGTYIDLCNKNSFVTENGIEWNDFISWIGKHKELIVEDRSIDEFVKVVINLYSNPEKIFVKSKEAFDFVYSPAKYICSKYSKQKAIELIYNYVDEAGILKKKTFTRTIHLMKLVDKADSNELAEPTFKTIEKMYEWLDKFSIDKGYRISYNTYQADLDAWTNSYIDMLGIKINTSYGFQKIKDNIIEMLNDLATKNTNKEGIRFDYNTVPNEDGVNYKHKKSVDTMIEKMFNITADNTTINKKPREKHVILVEQNW